MNSSSSRHLSRCTDSQHEGSSTTINIGYNRIPSSPSSNRDQRSSSRLRQLSMAEISHQLRLRKFLQNRLGFLSNIMCFLGLSGIILMIIENEINFANIHNHFMIINWFIKLVLSITTIILINLIIYYHYLNLKFFAAQNSLDDWRAGLTIRRIFRILLEILICAIHPIPRNSDEKKLNSYTPTYIAFDVAFGLPMFARLYLIFRCIKYNSYLSRDVRSKSFSSWNKVSINQTFLIKTYLDQWPARCLTIFCILIFFIGSWSIRACEHKPTNDKHMSIFDAMWLCIITFTTVGYGDLTPSTYYGRAVASIIALIGVLATALLISVVTQKLVLTRWEKHVNYYVSNIELTRQHREQAANVIKFAIKIWYLKRKYNHRSSYQYLKSEQILYKSIYNIRQIKFQQRKLHENCLDLVQLTNIQHYTNLKTKKIGKEITTIKLTIDNMKEQFHLMNNTINNIQYTLNQLLDKTMS